MERYKTNKIRYLIHFARIWKIKVRLIDESKAFPAFKKHVCKVLSTQNDDISHDSIIQP
jgi:hypothetical protein